MALSEIADLRADLLPHRLWPAAKWFYASPVWFYHRPRRHDERIVANRRFYELVDPELEALCHLFLRHGVLTTPSCQGHFYDRSRYERVWEELLAETARIGSDAGLVVKDCETDQPCRFRQAQFQLPWRDREAFIDHVTPHQAIGYLGAVVASDRKDLIERLEAASYHHGGAAFERQASPAGPGGELFAFIMHPRDPQERAQMWRTATETLRHALEGLAVTR